MVDSLRRKMELLFLTFFLLVSVSVIATFWTVQTQRKDALIVNLAGRQRMLVQRMTTEVLWVEQGKDEAHLPALQEAVHVFDQTLRALVEGGQTTYLPERMVDVPPTRQPHIRAGLQQVQFSWHALRAHLDTIMSLAQDPADADFKVAVQAIERLAPVLVQHADEVVRMYETASEQKTARLSWIQTAFFIAVLALLVMGSMITHRSVVQPLHVLSLAAERIGKGDLSTPVEIAGPREMQVLGHSFDIMRSQLKASEEDLRAWAGELEARVSQRTRELAALYEISREISSRLDIEHVLRSVTDKARDLLGGEVALLCLLDAGKEALTLQALDGPQEAVRAAHLTVQCSLASQVLAADRALPCGVDGGMGMCSIMAASFQASHLAAPLRMGERVIGALCVGSSQKGRFSDATADLLTKLANSAAIALENARLYQQAERVAMMEERQRIAAEMHDGVAQTLSYLGLRAEQVTDLVEAGRSAEAVTELQRIHAAIEQMLQEVRRSIASLQETPQPHRSLQERLAETVAEFVEHGEPPIGLAVSQTPLFLSSEEAEQVLRVVREALQNVHRHAGARQVGVSLEQRGTEAMITVKDDGRGFDPKTPPVDRSTHFGLRIMRARAARIGGRLEIDSVPGQGTRVVLSWPLAGSLQGR